MELSGKLLESALNRLRLSVNDFAESKLPWPLTVTDLLDSKRRPYIFQGVNINASSGREEDAGPDDPIPIWHRLDIENETIEFNNKKRQMKQLFQLFHIKKGDQFPNPL